MPTAMGSRGARFRPTWIVPPLRFPVFSNVRSLPEGVSNVVEQHPPLFPILTVDYNSSCASTDDEPPDTDTE